MIHPNERLACVERMEATLLGAMSERPERQGLAPAPDGGTEVEWVAFERQAMLFQVNRERGALGKSPVTVEDVLRVEGRAVGHSDYARKFAIGCADLVEDR